MNDFGDDLWKCAYCGVTFTDVEWTNFVPRWAQMEPRTQMLLHEACIKPYRVRERLLK